MRINAVSLINYIPSFFKEKIHNSLTNQQQRILAVVTIVLAVLVAASTYTFYRKLKSRSEEIEGDEQEFSPSGSKQLEGKTSFIISHLEDSLKEFKTKNIETVASKCFVKINFEEGEIKREFIIKNLTGTSIDTDFMNQQANKIAQCIEDEIQENFGKWTEINVATMFKDINGNNHFSQNGIQNSSKELSGNSATRYIMTHPSILVNIYKSRIVNQMGFPQEKQMQDGEFLPGTLYRNID